MHQDKKHEELVTAYVRCVSSKEGKHILNESCRYKHDEKSGLLDKDETDLWGKLADIHDLKSAWDVDLLLSWDLKVDEPD